MDTQQIIQELRSLPLEDLQQLSKAVLNEIYPSFEKLEEWENQKSDRKFEWLIHQFEGVYHAALVLFHNGQIDLCKGNFTDEISAKRVALRFALRKLILFSDTQEDEGSDSDSEDSSPMSCSEDSGPVPRIQISDSDSDSDSEEVMEKVGKFYKLNDITTGHTYQKQESIMKIYYDSQFSGKTPMEAAEKFFETLIGLYTKSGTYTFSLVSSDMETDRKFSFRGVRGINSNTVTPHMKWNEEKKIYTDGEFVYTSREKVYARLLDNGSLRSLTMVEENDLKSRDISFRRLSNISEIHAVQREEYEKIYLRRKHYDAESSSEDSESSSSEAEDSEDEEEHKCERAFSSSKIPCGKTARKCLNFPNSKVMWFCGDKNGGCYKVKIDELRHVLLHKKETLSSEEKKEPSEKEKEPSEEKKESENLESVQWNSSYDLYTDGKFVYSGSKRVFGRLNPYGSPLCDSQVKPLDITDILMLKEAKMGLVNNYHSNKIPFHVKESRMHHFGSELGLKFNSDINSDIKGDRVHLHPDDSDIEGDRVYPDDVC